MLCCTSSHCDGGGGSPVQCHPQLGGLSDVASRTVDDDAGDAPHRGSPREQSAPPGAVGPALVGNDDDVLGAAGVHGSGTEVAGWSAASVPAGERRPELHRYRATGDAAARGELLEQVGDAADAVPVKGIGDRAAVKAPEPFDLVAHDCASPEASTPMSGMVDNRGNS